MELERALILLEFDNTHYETVIGSNITVPDDHFFKAAIVTYEEHERYVKNGGDWANYKGYLKQYMIPGSPVVIRDKSS